MVIREAFAFGTPVAVSDAGPLPFLVKDGISGVVFPAKQPEMLRMKIEQAWELPGFLERISRGGRQEFEQYYTESKNYHKLLEIYRFAGGPLDGPGSL